MEGVSKILKDKRFDDDTVVFLNEDLLEKLNINTMGQRLQNLKVVSL
uniref:Uncharacterized LOC101243340 n=1 Tax=Ciona intestinalis TaxID=7719 RepID=H2Y3I2_CIOIN